MQCRRWVCGGMLYGMGVFSLCGTTGSQEIEKDDEAQVTEANVEETNEIPFSSELVSILNAIYEGDGEKALRLIGDDRDTLTK